MAANVETMFSVREKPWHGLGTIVADALTSAEALKEAGLDWQVYQQPIFTNFGNVINGYRANVRSTDNKVLGVVSDRYRVVQNEEAFEFTDGLLGEGVRYETAGSLQGGKKIWLLARLPRDYVMAGDKISSFLVFSNTHDGSGAVKVAITPVRVVCNNTLNLALNTANRSFSMIHTGDIKGKVNMAKEALFMAEEYMGKLGHEIAMLNEKKVSYDQVENYINELLPIPRDATETTKKNVRKQRSDITRRYYEAPDLKTLDHTAYRFINAVSDFATHAEPLRRTADYQENLFAKTVGGNPFIDRAYQLVNAA
jgi:phage/plasmid-like protein (TIGR03299 family)